VSATYNERTVIAALKIFSERWKEKYEKEVRSYEFLEHFSVWGVVPVAYGCDKDWKSERLHGVLGDALAPTSSLRSPVSVIMLEYIADSAPLSTDNVNWTICKETLRGLDLIHSAQVLHHDIGERNLLIVTSTGRVVWIDFSSSYINPDDMEIWQERGVVHSMLYQEVVNCLLRFVLIFPVTGTTGRRVQRAFNTADSARIRRRFGQ
jgi:serine/threonine protein kinase